MKLSSDKTTIQNFRRTLKNWFGTNIGTKLGVLLIAAVIWVYTILGNNYTYTLEVPLEIINVAPDKTLKERVPPEIKAEFTGKGIDFLYLFFSPKSVFKFVLDLQNIKWYYSFPLNQYYSNKPEKIVTPRNLSISFIKIVEPESLYVELDRFASIKIPIIPRLDLQPAAGYIKIGPPQLHPDSVIISGPRSYVKKHDKIYTRKYTAKKLKKPVEIELALSIPRDTNLDLSHNTVKIYQEVDQIGEKIFTDIPVQVINVPRGLTVKVSPSSISLNVSAGVSVLKNLTMKDFEVYFNFADNWYSQKLAYKPEIKLPPGVIEVKDMMPEQIKVRVVRERTS